MKTSSKKYKGDLDCECSDISVISKLNSEERYCRCTIGNKTLRVKGLNVGYVNQGIARYVFADRKALDKEIDRYFNDPYSKEWDIS
jgi:hypothetical protein